MVNTFRTSFPVLTGDVVMQGHADACEEFGHATHKIDGVVQSYCPRCGEVTASTRPEWTSPVNDYVDSQW